MAVHTLSPQIIPAAHIDTVGQSQCFSDANVWSSVGEPWSSGEQKNLEVCAVIDETPDVRTFVFRCGDLTALSFEPGQFITVSPQFAGQVWSRCYTLSSSPTRPFTFSITVKRVPGGLVSNWLHDNLRVGARLNASGPAGVFTPVGHPCRKLLYLSAGSGITPLMSMTRTAFDLRADLDIAFVHSARTPSDIVFRGELSRLEQAQSHFKVSVICEAVGDEPEWGGPLGRIDLSLLQQLVPDFLQREVFTCGPKGYMEAVQRMLGQGGFDLRHYHQESFDLGSGAEGVEPQPLQAATESEVFTVTLARSAKVFTMDGSQTLLSAARKAGAVVPSSCSQGVCGTCKTTIIEGSVEMQHKGGIRQREIDKGQRLLCCSRPTSDLVIDL
ncbi:hybrid-cluster NAD(P)-dependent oxidoreductase [Pseudomonas sp. CC120222-01a]|uniref:hybrid-cluster NAD(P)-dependent oxidoreductase n=1 Tax=Pseudomonas sp. CC120222-01a TaxID=1378075 RepID=UPI002114B776|nr:hybrid-cluster NAD(P)-dependent oxidoreductase [Pseudomonas sp. CC120222-01a]